MPKGNGKPIPKVLVNLKVASTEELLKTLEMRFHDNRTQHPEVEWRDIQVKLEADPQKLSSLNAMQTTGGEPDVVIIDDQLVFVDCSLQSPNRRKICYDREGEKLREKKGLYPGGNAIDLAKAMGIELLNQDQYRQLQEFGEFDTKTSSWLKTPEKIRNRGGAIFGDRRYDTVFIFHNGAESFYSDRGFR